jgi:hypothetical protein
VSAKEMQTLHIRATKQVFRSSCPGGLQHDK